MSVKEIATIRELSVVTVEGHLIKCAQERLEMNWDDIFAPDDYRLIIDTANRLSADKLKPLKEALPEHISYFMIKAALVKASMGD